MKNLPSRIALSLSILLHAAFVQSQGWTPVDPAQVAATGQRDIVPEQYVTWRMDPAAMKALLWSAPHERDQPVRTSPVVITTGLADGTTDDFHVVEYDMMEPGLSARYPDIRTFAGTSASDPYRRIRIDWTASGFRAVISDLA